MFQIGPYRLDNQVVLAPMAGVTDLPFRQLCRRMGAGLVVSEMLTSDIRLWNSRKSRYRLLHSLEPGKDLEIEPRSVQIAGSDPVMMAEAARMNVELGAQIIDINMGCPAKKVCKKAAGSALMKDERLVAEILQAVVTAVSVPVTLKTRTGWDHDNRNAVSIAKIAQESGIAALTIHGRTRACRYKGDAEYDTVAEVKSAITIPVIANGDIDSAQKAQQVLKYTNADAVMVGRAARGRPWICREIDQFLRNGVIVAPPDMTQLKQILLDHIVALHQFYGEFMGVKIARKHVGWYLHHQVQENIPHEPTAAKPAQHTNNKSSFYSAENTADFRRKFNQLDQAELQIKAINHYFDRHEMNLYGSSNNRQINKPKVSNNANHVHNSDDKAKHHQGVIAA